MSSPTSSLSSLSLRQRMRAGETLIGSWINSGSPIVAELMASCGFDFLCVDIEHSAVDLPQTQAPPINEPKEPLVITLNREGVPTIRGGTEWRPSSVQAAVGYKRPRRPEQ